MNVFEHLVEWDQILLRVSGRRLQEMITRMRGIESGHKQAEGFIRHIQSPEFELAGE